MFRREKGAGRRATLGLLIVAMPLLYYGVYFLLRGPLPPDPQFIAHRGGTVAHPENTLAAFRHAIDLGVDWIELDVQRTGDGTLVILHDETVDRTTNGSGRVADLLFEQVRGLDAGNGERVPTFAEVIELAKGANAGLLPEVKAPHLYPGMEGEMVDALREAGYLAQSLVQSFDHDVLTTLVEMEPGLGVCPLYGLWQFDLRRPQAESAEVLCPMAEMIVLYPWMIRQAHNSGRQVYVWFGVIEHPLVMRLLLAMGADGLMVDDPDALAPILGVSQ